LLDRETCYALLDGMDAVCAIASHPYFGGGNAQRIFNENTNMNYNIFQAAAELGLKKIVFSSSIQTIIGDRRHKEEGPQDPSGLSYLPIDGDMPANPGNPYALSKRCSEIMLEHIAKFHGLQCVALRWPALMSKEWFGGGGPWPRSGRRQFHALLDEGFSYLTYFDGARLMAAILRTDLPGYRQYLPAARNLRVPTPVAELLELYPNVPLRKPVGKLTGLVDISRIEQETGWAPSEEMTHTARAHDN